MGDLTLDQIVKMDKAELEEKLTLADIQSLKTEELTALVESQDNPLYGQIQDLTCEYVQTDRIFSDMFKLSHYVSLSERTYAVLDFLAYLALTKGFDIYSLVIGKPRLSPCNS